MQDPNGLNEVNAHPKPSVIIVGSGSSGIAAATRLIKNNFTNLIVLEAENRIGGRINSIHFGDAFVDMGAQFCHGEEGNVVYSLVKGLNVLKHSSKDYRFYYSNGETVARTLGKQIIEFAESLESGEEPICENVESVGECLDIRFGNFSNSLQDPNARKILSDSSDWINSHLCAFDSPFDINDLKITSAYKKCNGDLRLNWNGLGYKTILEILMQKYPDANNSLLIGNKILYNVQVTRIANWNSSHKVLVGSANGTQYEADHVVFTPSLGVLKTNHESLFKPHLPPEKVEAIRNIGFGAILKMQIHFPRRWWSEDANWLLIWSKKDKEILKQKNLLWLINLAKILQGENNPSVLTAWFAGKYVTLIEGLPEREVLEGLNYLINTFFGSHNDVVLPDNIVRSSWHSNPHFRGTYSYESVQGRSPRGTRFPEALGRPLTGENNKPTVLFAGEATHPHYFSTVHGAIESGYRVADRLIELYKNNV